MRPNLNFKDFEHLNEPLGSTGATFTAVITSTSTSLRRAYNLDESQLGLCFLANGGGCLLAAAINGPLLDRDYQVIAKQVELREASEESAHAVASRPRDLNNLLAFPIEHARLRSLRQSIFHEFGILLMSPTAMFVLLMVGSQIFYGWTIERRVHIAAPLLAQVLSL